MYGSPPGEGGHVQIPSWGVGHMYGSPPGERGVLIVIFSSADYPRVSVNSDLIFFSSLKEEY